MPGSANVDAIAAAVASPDACTWSTVDALQTLLTGAPSSIANGGSTGTGTGTAGAESRAGQRTKRNTTAPSKPTTTTTTKSRSKKAIETTQVSQVSVPVPVPVFADGPEKTALTPAQRQKLATTVVNEALKVLTQPQRAPAQPSKKSQSKSTKPKSSTTPPLTELTNGSSPARGAQSTKTGPSSGIVAIAECARLAFSHLRSANLKTIRAGGKANPQLEAGSAALIGRLIAHGLDTLALKELRALKKGLERRCSADPTQTDNSVDKDKETLATLLHMNLATRPQDVLPTIITYQTHVLRMMVILKQSSAIEAAAPMLRPSCPRSPTAHILQLAEHTKDNAKAAKQLDTLARTLSALCPQDAALSAELCFDLQTSALYTQKQWWRLAGHRPDEDAELLSPLAKHLDTYRTRSTLGAVEKFRIAYDNISLLIPVDSSRTSPAPQGPAAYKIFRLLSLMAQAASDNTAALELVRAMGSTCAKDEDNGVIGMACALRSDVLALNTTTSAHFVADHIDAHSKKLRKQWTKAQPWQLDALLVELDGLRRPLVKLLPQKLAAGETLDGDMRNLCHALFCCIDVLRSIVRDTSIPSSGDDAPNDIAMPAIVAKLIEPFVTSGIMVCRAFIRSSDPDLAAILEALQNCHALACVTDDTRIDACRVSISNLFWYGSQKLGTNDAATVLPWLRGSVNALELASIQHQEEAQLTSKLERLEKALTSSGDTSAAFDIIDRTLRQFHTRGLLANMAAAARSTPFHQVMSESEQSRALTKSLIAAHRGFATRNGSSCLYDDDHFDTEERAILLEFQLDIFTQAFASRSASKPSRSSLNCALRGLLDVYSPGLHPLRRARLSCCILIMAKEYPTALDQALVDEALAFVVPAVPAKSKDDLLMPFLKDTRASLILAQTFHTSESPECGIKSALSLWKNVLEECISALDLRSRIYELDQFTLRLQQVSAFAALRGLDDHLLLALEVHRLFHEVSASADSSELVQTSSLLALQCARMGYSDRASDMLRNLGTLGEQKSLSPFALAQYHVAKGHCSLVDEDPETLIASATEIKELLTQAEVSSERYAVELLEADFAYAVSLANLQLGSFETALQQAKHCLSINQQLLKHVKRKQQALMKSALESSQDVQDLVDNVKAMNISDSSNRTSQEQQKSYAGPRFWPLIPRLLRSLTLLYRVYAHLGLRVECDYYHAQLGMLSTAMGCITPDTSHLLIEAKHSLAIGQKNMTALTEQVAGNAQGSNSLDHLELQIMLGDAFRRMKSWDAALEAYNRAETSATRKLQEMAQVVSPPTKRLVQSVKSQEPKRTRGATTTRIKQPVKRAQAVTAAVKRIGKEQNQTQVTREPQNVPLSNMLAICYRNKSLVMSERGDLETAKDLLDRAAAQAQGQRQAAMQAVAEAQLLTFRWAEEASADVTLNVLPESSISYPALSFGGALDTTTQSSSVKANKKTALQKQKGRKREASGNFVEWLSNAQDRITALLPDMAGKVPLTMSYGMCELASQTSMLLSAVSSGVPHIRQHPTYAAFSLELPRIEAARRELCTLSTESHGSFEEDSVKDHLQATDASPSAEHFQQDFIDIIPATWSAVSLVLNEDCTELYITRYQANRTPFILRLPMSRHKLQDVDEDEECDFDFEAGRAELKEIIRLSDYSCHTPPENTKAAKIAWWAEREALDDRLHELLVNIENLWIGGFKGMFSQHRRDAELLARFRKTFEAILDRHLPSRQGTKGASGDLSVDSNILELFIGLGYDDDGALDIDEQLMDLLYFVIDALQFGGERNAYDEVDFDSMATETLDALRSYHEGASTQLKSEGSHLILILDKRLHAFPWESMPCLESVSVSRVGSMFSLRERILAMRLEAQQSALPSVSRTSGTYVLNPSNDLTNTQATFQPLLTTLAATANPSPNPTPTWQSITNRAPTEPELVSALTHSQMLLYFGHGSGAQYIRNRAIRKLDSCARVIWLMGCSSGAVAENGDFEPTSVPLAYLVAGHAARRRRTNDCSSSESPNHGESHGNGMGEDGMREATGHQNHPAQTSRPSLCMAVVATLWDVTDKDIDRFAVRVGREWGLWPDPDPLGDSAMTPPPSSSSSSTGARPLAAVGTAALAPPKTPGRKARGTAAAPTATATATAGVMPPKTPCNNKTPGAARAVGTTRKKGAVAAVQDEMEVEAGVSSPPERRQKKSLVEAVVKGRQECKLRYLNGAATVVYGVPVWLGD